MIKFNLLNKTINWSNDFDGVCSIKPLEFTNLISKNSSDSEIIHESIMKNSLKNQWKITFNGNPI